MLTPSYTPDRRIYVPDNSQVQPRRIPVLASLTGCTILGLTVLILAVIAVARLQPSPQPVDISPDELADSASSQSCEIFMDHYMPRCYTVLLGLSVYLQPLTNSKTITRTVDASRFFTLGQLVAAWGTPTGVLWQRGTIRVYWPTRSALLVTHSLQTDSRVFLILYEMDQPDTSPWRGFRLSQG